MRLLLSTVLVVLTASAEPQGFSLFARSGFDKRQVCTVEEITPTSCETCFGAGSVNCLAMTCYNPTKGESCCSDGNFCPANNYCTDAGCCPNGTPLEQCGATVSLSVVPVPGSEVTSAAGSASSTVSAQSESSAPTVASDATSAVATSTSTVTATPIATFTGAAAQNVVAGGQGVLYAILMVVGNLF